ncbi:hypothetical protein [Methylomonas rapida]|uniref:Uncharacterized protein n=1 Tax=Methylomonas rapida TaxID=2963939 RepID=A0ABY7GDQ1_9GAMM|nr:hypothetical protein [Methylomonas rapida]WAR43417.1 hypothetical protein NM686_013600 [Methylomonas rapida]
MTDFNPETELKSLFELSDYALMSWLAVESPGDRRRQKALELLAEASMLLCNALKNLGAVSPECEGWHAYDR